jgi:hypothetical protein
MRSARDLVVAGEVAAVLVEELVLVGGAEVPLRQLSPAEPPRRWD